MHLVYSAAGLNRFALAAYKSLCGFLRFTYADAMTGGTLNSGRSDSRQYRSGLPAEMRSRTLRLALAMRGGVSLAVWIGGAVAELDLFRRACNAGGDVPGVFDLAPLEHPEHHVRGTHYRTVFAQTVYEQVRIDILAGTSAGGLNAVLFAMAQNCRVVMDEAVRRTWVEQGSIWNLLQMNGSRRIPSILQGDGKLFALMRTALRTIAEPDPKAQLPTLPYGSEAPPRLTVELAATLLDDPLDPKRDNRARFSFTKTAGSLDSRYTTIPADCASKPAKDAIDRLAVAARATSSFPGAFEPANVLSVAAATEPAKAESQAPAPADVNMAAAFIHARESGEPRELFHVVDGGIFDNIPIDRALRAIQRSPATEPSKRHLIYLDPEPPLPTPPNLNPDDNSALAWLPVIRRSTALKQRTETADGELGGIVEHNESVADTLGRQAMLAAELSEMEVGDGAAERSPQLVDAYRQARIAEDSERYAELLTDPWSELCRPPRDARDYRALLPETALSLHSWVQDAYTADAGLPEDIYARIGESRVLIGWIHALEDLAEGAEIRTLAVNQKRVEQPTPAEQLRAWKQTCYRCLTALIAAKQYAIDEILAEPLRGPSRRDYDKTLFIEKLGDSREMQTGLQVPTTLIELLDADGWTEFYNCLGENFPPTAATPTEPSVTFLETIGKRLDELKTTIVERSGDWMARVPAREPSVRWRSTWESSIYRQFYAERWRSRPLSELHQLVATVGGPVATPLVRFHRITSDEPPALTVEFAELVDGARAKKLEAWLRRLPQGIPTGHPNRWPEMEQAIAESGKRPLLADAKLSGNVLNRFGGFFAARWRENDWYWGRLDAAAGIVRMLTTDEGGDDSVGTPADDGVVADLQRSILDESRSTETSGGAGAKAIVQTAGAEGLDTISPRYRFSLASRIAPLVYRALRPPKEAGLSMQSVGGVLLQAILRPLAVPLVLIADPLRLAWALVLILGSAAALGAGSSPELWQVISSATLFFLAVWIFCRARKAYANRCAVRDRLVTIAGSQDWIKILDKTDTRRWRNCAWVVAGIVAASALYEVVVLVLRALHHNNPMFDVPSEAFLMWSSGIFFAQHFLNQRAYRVAPALKRNKGRTAWGIATAIAGIGVIALAEFIAHYQDWGLGDRESRHQWWDSCPATWIIAAVAVALLTHLSLWGWTKKVPAALVIVVAAALAGLLQGFLDHGARIYDLLPTVVWIGVVALVHPLIPPRGVGEDYGETGRPALKLG
jgi:predicted acylesterase/phospholipase RssA